MCYHPVYLYLTCGHAVMSNQPVQRGPRPPCQLGQRSKSQDLMSRDICNENVAGYIDLICPEQLIHPFHTFHIEDMCRDCLVERNQRIAAFEIQMIADTAKRMAQKRHHSGIWVSDKSNKILGTDYRHRSNAISSDDEEIVKLINDAIATVEAEELKMVQTFDSNM